MKKYFYTKLFMCSEMIKEKYQRATLSIFDISEMEEKKQEVDDFSNEMINVNRRKDTFISIVSHDLKSPYTTLLGFSEILLNDSYCLMMKKESTQSTFIKVHNIS